MIFFVADKFRVYFALESLFLAFLEFTLENTEYTKLVEFFFEQKPWGKTLRQLIIKLKGSNRLAELTNVRA